MLLPLAGLGVVLMWLAYLTNTPSMGFLGFMMVAFVGFGIYSAFAGDRPATGQYRASCGHSLPRGRYNGKTLLQRIKIHEDGHAKVLRKLGVRPGRQVVSTSGGYQEVAGDKVNLQKYYALSPLDASAFFAGGAVALGSDEGTAGGDQESTRKEGISWGRAKSRARQLMGSW